MANQSEEMQWPTLEQLLWKCRVDLRNVEELDDTRNAFLSLEFLRLAGEKFEKRRAELMKMHGENPAYLEKTSLYYAKGVFYFPEHLTGDENEWSTRWSYLKEHSDDENLAAKLDRALDEIQIANPPLKGLLPQDLFVTMAVEKEKLQNLINDIDQIRQEKFRSVEQIDKTYNFFLHLYASPWEKGDDEILRTSCLLQLILGLIDPNA